MTIPTYLPYFVFAGALAAVTTILYGLNRALADAAWPPADRTRAFRVSAAILIGWLALSIALAAMGVYHVGASAIPTIQYGIALPILIGSLLLWRSDTVARLLDAVPQQWLIGVQLYRALGVIFLILYVAGKLPGLFAWPAGVGDIAIGLLAPVVGLAYAPSSARYRWPRQGLERASASLDLVVAVTTGFITRRRSFSPIDVQPNSELMTMLPMVLIPVYLVPLSIMLHIASLAKLHRATAPNGNRVAQSFSVTAAVHYRRPCVSRVRTRGRCLIPARTRFPASRPDAASKS